MTPETEALLIFRSLSRNEQLTYLSRLRALADKLTPAPVLHEEET